MQLWRLLANAYTILCAPWPLFGLMVVLLTALSVVAPLVQIRATAGLIDTLAAGAAGGMVVPEVLLGAALPHLFLLVGALAAGVFGARVRYGRTCSSAMPSAW
jgi:hypothetical protein